MRDYAHMVTLWSRFRRWSQKGHQKPARTPSARMRFGLRIDSVHQRNKRVSGLHAVVKVHIDANDLRTPQACNEVPTGPPQARTTLYVPMRVAVTLHAGALSAPVNALDCYPAFRTETARNGFADVVCDRPNAVRMKGSALSLTQSKPTATSVVSRQVRVVACRLPCCLLLP